MWWANGYNMIVDLNEVEASCVAVKTVHEAHYFFLI